MVWIKRIWERFRRLVDIEINWRNLLLFIMGPLCALFNEILFIVCNILSLYFKRFLLIIIWFVHLLNNLSNYIYEYILFYFYLWCSSKLLLEYIILKWLISMNPAVVSTYALTTKLINILLTLHQYDILEWLHLHLLFLLIKCYFKFILLPIMLNHILYNFKILDTETYIKVVIGLVDMNLLFMIWL
jgi:hypothetical protein